MKISLFADDVIIWYTHWNKWSIKIQLQKTINAFDTECKNLLLEINTSKCTYTLFARNGNIKHYAMML